MFWFRAMENPTKEFERRVTAFLRRTRLSASEFGDRATMAMFLKFFGGHRRPDTLSRRDWDRFIRARHAGKAGRSRRPVANRTIQQALSY